MGLFDLNFFFNGRLIYQIDMYADVLGVPQYTHFSIVNSYRGITDEINFFQFAHDPFSFCIARMLAMILVIPLMTFVAAFAAIFFTLVSMATCRGGCAHAVAIAFRISVTTDPAHEEAQYGSDQAEE